MNKVKKMLYLSMILGIALVVHVIEAQIPVIFPGIKLGLANAVSLFVLISFGGKEAITIMILRTILGSIFGGNAFSFFFSIFGGLFSNIAMIGLYGRFKGEISIPWLSIGGAIFHNIGQLLVAAVVVKDFKIYFYLPILMTAAVITGYFTGIIAGELHKRGIFGG